MTKLLLSLALIASLCGAETIATFRSVNGSVSVESTDGKSKAAAKNGMAVAVGFLIRTAASAKADLALADGSLITIGERSAIVLNRNIIGTKDRKNTSFGVLMGGMKLKVNKLTGKDEFKVQTPTAVAAVRGTDFEVALASDGSTMVAVSEGKVNVAGDSGSADVKRGESGSVVLGEEKSVKSGKADTVTSFLRERDAAVKNDPAGTIEKMEDRSRALGDQGGSLLVKASDSKADHTALNDGLNRLSDGNEAIKMLADGVYSQNKENPNVLRAYKTLTRIYEANEKLEAKIAAALARIDARVNAVNQKIDTKSRMLDSLELNK